jgi:flagellar operon protein
MVVNNSFTNRVNGITRGVITKKTNVIPSGDFNSVLQERINEIAGLKFSKHAEQRLQARNISLTQTQKTKMNEAVSKAESKGVKDSLVLMDNLAFVVNVKSRTVITAVSSNELKENVFTNIDGAVIV